MSYQYNVEVVNAIPADALGGGATPASKITLHCVRRDATFECASVPTAFEVRNAPDYDLLECALVKNDAAHTVVARAATSLVIGGPHRTVGAVWVPLEARPDTLLSEGDMTPTTAATTASSSATVRVFVAWTMLNMDGSPVSASSLEAPPHSLTSGGTSGAVLTSSASATTRAGGTTGGDVPLDETVQSEGRGDSATPRASVETSPLGMADVGGSMMTPVSVLSSSSSRRVSAATAHPHNGGSVSGNGGIAGGGDTLPAAPGSNSSSNNNNAESSGLTAHVSIVLDEAQEAAQQQRDGDRVVSSLAGAAAARRMSVDVPSSTLQSGVVEGHSYNNSSSMAGGAAGGGGEFRSTEEEAQHVQNLILAQFPKCSVSSSLGMPMPDDESNAAIDTTKGEGNAEKAVEVGNNSATTSPERKADDTASPASFVDYYATSTQSISGLPLQTRYRNLYLAPCPLLLDQLAAGMPPAGPKEGGSLRSMGVDGGAYDTSRDLWKVSHCHSVTKTQVGSAHSALEAIRREHEMKWQKTQGAPATTDDTGAKGGAAGAKSLGATDNGEEAAEELATPSTLTLLRQQAMLAMRQRRVAYST